MYIILCYHNFYRLTWKNFVILPSLNNSLKNTIEMNKTKLKYVCTVVVLMYV